MDRKCTLEKDIYIPSGNTPEDNKARRRIIQRFYSRWILDHPDRVIWNRSLNGYIHVKGTSVNEILGHAPRSVEATKAQFYLSEILSNAILIDQWPPKYGNNNQKSFSKILFLRYKRYRLLVGLQKTKNEYVLYYISGGQKIKAAR